MCKIKIVAIVAVAMLEGMSLYMGADPSGLTEGLLVIGGLGGFELVEKLKGVNSK